MQGLAPAFVFLLAAASFAAPPDIPLNSVAELNAFLRAGEPGKRPFAVVGCVTHLSREAFVLEDADARVYLIVPPDIAAPPHGARTRVDGVAHVPKTNLSIPFPRRPEPLAHVQRIEILETGEPPRPLRVGLGEINPVRHNLSLLEISGSVLDAARDEFDSKYVILLLGDGANSLPVSIGCDRLFDLHALVGAKVSVVGLLWKNLSGVRKFSGPLLVADRPDALRILSPPEDPFAAPRLENLRYVSPAEVSHLGRRTVDGRVLATWGRNHFMLQTDDGRIMQTELALKKEPPRCGTCVMVAGWPRADMLQIRMTRAVFREKAAAPPPESVAPESLSAILRKSNGGVSYEAAKNGALVSFQGLIVGRPRTDGLFTVNTEETVVTVDASTHCEALDALKPNTFVRVTGVCLLEGPAWSAENIFPRIESFRVVVRGAEDIQILARPPWWTPGRLLVAVVFLLAVIAAILVWNRSLNRLAVRRGRALLREQIGHEREALRVGERTRLAVELHDSLSQCLSGLACQVAATRSLINRDPRLAGECLGAAERMLQSSRTELQRCLFDLRGDALGEADFAKALRQTLAPISSSSTVDVQFTASRARMSDTIAHAIICIVRELVSNAVRHGHAEHVEVCGEGKDGRIVLFVRDDGCGFDVAQRPGPDTGHFGLEGIRERTRRLGGTLHIESTPGQGTTAFVDISLHSPIGKAGTADE